MGHGRRAGRRRGRLRPPADTETSRRSPAALLTPGRRATPRGDRVPLLGQVSVGLRQKPQHRLGDGNGGRRRRRHRLPRGGCDMSASLV